MTSRPFINADKPHINKIPEQLSINQQEVEALFERINKEQNGKRDLVVNNAYAGVKTINANMGKPFWETPAEQMWDDINGVGLRGHYLCTVYASRRVIRWFELLMGLGKNAARGTNDE